MEKICETSEIYYPERKIDVDDGSNANEMLIVRALLHEYVGCIIKYLITSISLQASSTLLSCHFHIKVSLDSTHALFSDREIENKAAGTCE